MADIQKVIKCFECCTNRIAQCPDICPYYYKASCQRDVAKDALELLKEQEAKCLLKDELNQLQKHEFVWYESVEGFVYCMEIIGICYGISGKVSYVQFNTPTAYVEKSAEGYGEQYRIWTKQPTKEQMSNLKWN